MAAGATGGQAEAAVAGADRDPVESCGTRWGETSEIPSREIGQFDLLALGPACAGWAPPHAHGGDARSRQAQRHASTRLKNQPASAFTPRRLQALHAQ